MLQLQLLNIIIGLVNCLENCRGQCPGIAQVSHASTLNIIGVWVPDGNTKYKIGHKVFVLGKQKAFQIHWLGC